MNETEIKDAVRRIEADKLEYYRLADRWERMWKLEHFAETAEEMVEEYGQERVIIPTPQNVVNLGMRMIADEPIIEIPSSGVEEDDEAAAGKRKRWLNAVWQRTCRETRRNPINDAKWFSFVRGRFSVDIRWVRDLYPKTMRDRKMPVLVRGLDPLNTGSLLGDMFVQAVYHKYRERREVLAQLYPDHVFDDDYVPEDTGLQPYYIGSHSQRESEVIDYWWRDTDGSVWNAVLIDGVFAIKPRKTLYVDLPIIEGYADSSPLNDETYRGLSLLHGIYELWKYQNRLASLTATGLLYYLWPIIKVTTTQGTKPPDIKRSPGAIYPLPAGADMDVVHATIDLGLVRQMTQQIESEISKSTWPGVMFGEEPGQIQAGYGINILAQQARGRVNQTRQSLESALEYANQLILSQVETNAGKEGVEIWGWSKGDGAIYRETLTPKDIQGYYENMVRLTPEMPTDDVQKLTLGLRLVEEQIISRQTFRSNWLNMPMPADEDIRVNLEQALMSEPMAPKTYLRVLQARFPKTWADIVSGTELEQFAHAEQEAQQPSPEEGSGMPPVPPELMQQMMMQQQMPPQMPQQMPPQMPVQAPGPVQNVPPQMVGQLTPEMLGLPPGTPPEIFYELTGQELPTLNDMLTGGRLPPEMAGLMGGM
jgi:hypothetical protein